jgi:hypothetical protein
VAAGVTWRIKCFESVVTVVNIPVIVARVGRQRETTPHRSTNRIWEMRA